MKRCRWFLVLLALSVVGLTSASRSQESAPTRIRDVIYGRKLGVALTMDVFKPAKPNGIGILWMVSGGWVSRHSAINPGLAKLFTDRGETVFAVVHGSRPKFTLKEIGSDIQRATRFVRAHAAEYGVDPNKLGISGGSSGGHLSLWQSVSGDDGDPKAKDPVDRVSSRIQAVACFFPPTDFLNWGKEGTPVYDLPLFKPFKAGTGFNDDPKHNEALAKQLSPIYAVSKRTPPTLIIHGDADTLVPLQQSQRYIAKLTASGVKNKLIVRPGKGHGWPGIEKDAKIFTDWFEEILLAK